MEAHGAARSRVGLADGGEERLVVEPHVAREAQPIARAPDDIARPQIDGRQRRVPGDDDEEFAGAAEPKHASAGRAVPPAHFAGAEIDRGKAALASAHHEHARQAR